MHFFPRAAVSAAFVVSLAACRGPSGPPASSPRTPLPQVAGTLAVRGLSAPAVVVRDRWGVPHISAENADDLFFTQGFVQAQDRLFQMDLWRRSVQGRLSEVLGANFLERDTMTRRVQYRGDIEVEWASYGAGTRRIVTAFVGGINAWIDASRDALPDEFRLAGWTPEHWQPEDLLNRTDAFLASAGAQDEVFRARLTAAVGIPRANALLPAGGGPPPRSPGVDLEAITYRLGETLLRVGTPPFFSGFSAPFAGGGSNAWAAPGGTTATGAALLAVDPHRRFDAPALRYLVHLTAPGWNVIGATAPWLPGVVIGHNEYVAWGMTAANADVQDIYVERLNPANPRQIERQGRWVDMIIEPGTIAVRGREEPFEYERQYTAHGVVIGFDRPRHLAYTLRWSGSEPGTASELAALSFAQSRSAAEFESTLAWWKMPAADFVFADAAEVRQQRAALVPIRSGSAGALPVAGWTGAHEWNGWLPLARLAHRRERSRPVLSANGDPARIGRIEVALAQGPPTVEGFSLLQRDTLAWNASRLIPLLDGLPTNGDAAAAKARLLAWDRRITPGSPEAALYIEWERAMAAALAGGRVPADLSDDLAERLPLVAVMTNPTSTWFDGTPRVARDALLTTTLVAVDSAASAGGPGIAQVTFSHPLGISEQARRRFNVGPFSPGGYAGTVQAISSRGRIGPSFRAVFDVGDWDRSIAVSPPGQSGWPDSPHYADLAALWAAGDSFPLAFTPAAVQASAETTLTLTPR